MTNTTKTKTSDKLDQAHALMVEAIENLTTGDDWAAMLETSAKFHQYSANNVFLIMLQRPDATRVAGFKAWQGLGRQVRKGEKGLRILAPCLSTKTDETTGEKVTGVRGFTTVAVFDISQTDGEPIPDVKPDLITGDGPAGLWEALAAQVASAGFTLERGDCGTANGLTCWADHSVKVRADVDDAQACKTLAHELAHVMLHEGEQGECRSTKEVEAESVAFLVCQAAGLDTAAYTFPYVGHWAKGDTETVRKTADRVVKTARTICEKVSSGSAAGLAA